MEKDGIRITGQTVTVINAENLVQFRFNARVEDNPTPEKLATNFDTD